ncbi:putative acetate kinase [Talaromyces proteolyticus]|uniref:Probable acetate kinase n=1 Tax=Talaromyces proteolyticus TaxID=1131652 RepID=A0AAD4KJ53_9EURO|nr:putative acetate kinase [Talaromyces proteolyticus]KAH8692720.1 putative acetate kinase [Talaromyces proteolyticus]
MPRIILSVNAGSSSVKATFYTLDNPPSAIIEAQVSGITAPPQTFKYSTKSDQKKEKLKYNLGSPPEAFKYLLQRCLTDPVVFVSASPEDVVCICHRIVHGGDYTNAIEINDETYHQLEEIEDLAPLHNFPALEIIRTCRQELPLVKNIAHFDSAFHHSLPKHVRTYPIDQEVARRNKLRKYGFHGISYAFILRSVAQFLGKPQDKTSLIVMHIGSGASVCAIKDGKSIDTSMGLTPLAGLPGATRSGDIDPSLVFHYTSEASSLSPSSTKEMHISTAEEILNKKSGWKGLTGTTDFAQIAVENPPTENHKLAFDILVDRISGFVGNYFVKLHGQLDAIVFAGGIGEKSALLRQAVAQQCSCLGFNIEAGKNSDGAVDENTPVTDVTRDAGNGPRVLICQTNEQFEMAYHTIAHMKVLD